MKPLLIGQAPGPNTDPDMPLFPLPKTSAGGRLRIYSGLWMSQYMTWYDRVNLLYAFPGKDGNGEDKFPRPLARVAADAMVPLLQGRTVVMIGRNVSRAFHFDAPFFLWHGFRGMRAVVVPHTSGRARVYNDPENRESLRRVMQEARNFDAATATEELPPKLWRPNIPPAAVAVRKAEIYADS